jgi:16S rRNA (cytosine1402-N4)-methyltransferase
MTAPNTSDGNPEGPAEPRRQIAPSLMSGGPRHIPVLLAQMLAALAPKAGETYIDATFGAGGYSRAILDAADCTVLALDRDSQAVRDALPVTQDFPNRLTVVEAPFSRMEEVARVHLSRDSTSATPSVFTPPDGIVLDIGVSSMQIDEAGRGFSFQRNGPLDMRMGAAGRTAADVVNETAEEDLANILYDLGEERRSRAIARAIVRQREMAPLTTTAELASLVSRVLGYKQGGGKKGHASHPATRTFQALRIHVNDELGELEQALEQAERLLKPGGRLVVVTFHSLEDRIVKRFFTERTGRTPAASRHQPGSIMGMASTGHEPRFRFVNPRPISPEDDELSVNPRARSARLRFAERTGAPALTGGDASGKH